MKVRKEWVVNPVDKEKVLEVSKRLNIPYLAALILFSRGYKTHSEIERFLEPRLEHMHSPFLLPDMDAVIKRLVEAKEKKEKVLVYGDYDVDGITGTALLVRILKKLGYNVDFYIPHRLREGYGLSNEGVKFAFQNGFSLIITNDCGISAFQEVSLARKYRIDVIILDHHEPPDQLPFAIAAVNPKRKDSNYPFKELAGVGLVLKTLYALIQELGYNPKTIYNHLDIAAIGTVADVVPLVDENRIITKFGLSLLKKTQKPGLRALLDVVGIKEKEITPWHISYIIAPRLNASGRISEAIKGVKLILAEESSQAEQIAKELEKYNQQRKNIEDKILEEGKKEAEKKAKDRWVLVLAKEGWHEGVIGIVASRLAEEFYKPVIMLSLREDVAKGSARSIPGFSIYHALKYSQDLLLSFGGHEAAAGLMLHKGLVEDFEERINNYASRLPKEIFKPVLKIDAFGELNLVTKETFEIFKKFRPFGMDNPEPVFAVKGLEVVGYPRVIGEKHLKFSVRQGSYHLPVIAPGQADLILNLKIGEKEHLDMAFTITEDNYWGKNRLLLQLKDAIIK